MSIENGRARARRKTTTVIATVAAALIGVITLANGTAASAAEYDYPSAIDPASITIRTTDGDEALALHDQVRIDAAWSVPDGAVAGQTFGFALPQEFARAGLTFSVPSLQDPDLTVAECTVSADAAPVVTCTLTDYVNGRTGVTGTLWFLASADAESDQGTVGFTVDGQTTWVEVPGGGIAPSGHQPAEPQKWSWQTEDGRIVWELALPGASFVGAQSITVDDTVTGAGDGFAAHRNEDGRFVVWSTDAVGDDRRAITDGTGAWNAEGTLLHLVIPGPIDGARQYYVEYVTVPNAPAEGAVYGNSADVNGIVLQDTQSWRVTGGGSGDGTMRGGFAVTKVVDGSGAGLVPTDIAYALQYTYGDPAVEGTLTVGAGETTPAVDLPAGTVVTLREVAPSAVDGIEWGVPTFSGSGVRVLADGTAQFTVATGSTVAVTLTNTATNVPPEPVPPAETAPPTEVPSTGMPPAELPLTGQAALATTGGGVPAGLLWGGGAVLALGIALVVRDAIRRRSAELAD